MSSRDVIENWFDLFQLKFRSKSEFSIQIVELLVYLAQEDIISALDVHHQLSIVINNGLYEYDKTIFNNDNDPFVSILKLRKFQGIKSSDQDVQFLTIKDIEKTFKKKIQRIDKDSALAY